MTPKDLQTIADCLIIVRDTFPDSALAVDLAIQIIAVAFRDVEPEPTQSEIDQRLKDMERMAPRVNFTNEIKRFQTEQREDKNNNTPTPQPEPDTDTALTKRQQEVYDMALALQKEGEPITATALGEALDVTHQAARFIMDKIVDKGRAEKITKEDGPIRYALIPTVTQCPPRYAAGYRDISIGA